jgi:hypothetical protein
VVEELDLFVELLDLAFQPIGGEVGFAAADPARRPQTAQCSRPLR